MMEGLTQRLRLIRSQLGFTQKEMAERVNVKYRSWQDYENGKSVPGGKVLGGIALLGVNTNWLLTGEGPMRVAADSLTASGGLLELVAAAMREVVAEMDERGDPERRDFLIDALVLLYRKLSAQPTSQGADYLLSLKRRPS